MTADPINPKGTNPNSPSQQPGLGAKDIEESANFIKGKFLSAVITRAPCPLVQGEQVAAVPCLCVPTAVHGLERHVLLAWAQPPALSVSIAVWIF